MHEVARKPAISVRSRPQFECIALLLQGGGALGAYQGGVYQALSEPEVLERPNNTEGVPVFGRAPGRPRMKGGWHIT